MTENFVLVHGAWHGGWAWQPVASRLRAAGHRVWAPTCPGLGIDDDPRGVTLAGCIDSLVSQVEASFAVDVTLVGHSWGGYVIAGAAARLASRLKALVFWSAFVPQTGRPLYDESRRATRSCSARWPGHRRTTPSRCRWRCSRAPSWATPTPPRPRRCTRCCARSRSGRSPIRLLTRRTSAWASRCTTCCPEDVALPPGEFGWDRFAERIKVTPVRVPGSHESMFTRPAELAGVLAQVATG